MSTHVSFNIFTNTFQTEPLHTTTNAPLEDFIEWLRELHKRTFANKADNQLLCPALFLPGMGRAIANVVEANCGLWLDNDTGHYTPEQFAKQFPDLHFVAFNTFSSTKEKPKYRLFIPTNDGMDADCYAASIEEFSHCIAKNDPNHGYDPHPKFASALYYLPCQAASGHSFFVEQPGKVLDIEKWVMEAFESAKSRASANWLSTKVKITTHHRQSRPMLALMPVLEKIPADDYSKWRQVCCAIFNEYGEDGFELFDWWSSRSPKYNLMNVRREWEKLGNRTTHKTLGTIYYFAKESN